METPPTPDMCKITKIHFIIHARIFITQFVGYFDFDPDDTDIRDMVKADIQRQLIQHNPALAVEELQKLVPEQYELMKTQKKEEGSEETAIDQYNKIVMDRHTSRRKILCDMLTKFLSFFNDVPKKIDKDHHTELLYSFSKKGDEIVTDLLTQFHKMIGPYKDMLDSHDEKLWGILDAQLKESKHHEKVAEHVDEEQFNLFKQLDIYNSWQDCDDDARKIIWSRISILVGYGRMYSTYSIIPDDLMTDMAQCAHTAAINQTQSGGNTESMKASLMQALPQMMQKMDLAKVMKVGLQMFQQNPKIGNAMMNMANSMNGSTPNMDVSQIMQQFMPPGMGLNPEDMQKLMGNFMQGVNPSQITPEMVQMAAQAMDASSSSSKLSNKADEGGGGGGGGAKTD